MSLIGILVLLAASAVAAPPAADGQRQMAAAHLAAGHLANPAAHPSDPAERSSCEVCTLHCTLADVPSAPKAWRVALFRLGSYRIPAARAAASAPGDTPERPPKPDFL